MLSAEEIIAEVTARAKAITTLKGEGEITVESHDGSTSASFDVYLKKPDSVRVEFKGPFGLRVGTLLLTKDKFILYDRTENTAIVGTPDGKTLQSLFRLKMQFEEILSAFTGEFFFKNTRPTHSSNFLSMTTSTFCDIKKRMSSERLK